jgi:hypothetical protein
VIAYLFYLLIIRPYILRRHRSTAPQPTHQEIAELSTVGPAAVELNGTQSPLEMMGKDMAMEMDGDGRRYLELEGPFEMSADRLPEEPLESASWIAGDDGLQGLGIEVSSRTRLVAMNNGITYESDDKSS